MTPAAKAGERRELYVERLGVNGEGVARLDGLTVFVPLALPGESVAATITAVKRNYAVARVEQRLNDSRARVEPPCPLYEHCGGCQLQHLSYAAQLRAKREQVAEAFAHLGRLRVQVSPTLGAADPWHYRNKVQFPVGRNEGSLQIGCYERATHHIIDCQSCLIQREENNEIVAAVRAAITRFGLAPYNEDKRTGLVRHVMGRVSASGKSMVVLVTATPDLPHERELTAFLRKRLPHMVSFQQNVQTYHNNVILGRDTRVVWGQNTLVDRLCGLGFHISARSFFQVNTGQAETLYRTARDFAALTGAETLIDAYCGTGAIALFMAGQAQMVYGVDVVTPAVYDAKRNAKDNGIGNAEFLIGDTCDVLPRLRNRGVKAEVVIVDPPRAGCDEAVLRTIAAMSPLRLVYVSCNPATLARDCALLLPLGYRVAAAQPVDMFPMTAHVETVAVLTRV